jgi:hypothetical protein
MGDHHVFTNAGHISSGRMSNTGDGYSLRIRFTVTGNRRLRAEQFRYRTKGGYEIFSPLPGAVTAKTCSVIVVTAGNQVGRFSGSTDALSS